MPLYKLSVLVMAASYLLWLPSTGYGWLMAFAATLGVDCEVRIALTPVVLIEFFGVGSLDAILGVFFRAISVLDGPLVAGFMIDQTGSYQGSVAFALAMRALGFVAVDCAAGEFYQRFGPACLLWARQETRSFGMDVQSSAVPWRPWDRRIPLVL